MKPVEKKIAIELRNDGYTFDKIIKTMREMGYSVSKGGLHKWFKAEGVK
jgi:intein-encoded DNA endonuclease-like protein